MDRTAFASMMSRAPSGEPSVLHVVGARPNFVKLAPIVDALSGIDGLGQVIVHTGQHYDDQISGQLFRELGLPEPDVNLGVGSGSHAVQTARVMTGLEPILREVRPEWVFVPGDVNSTAAATLTASKLQIPVAHVEAGLRSGDRSMPEELNRIVTDHLSDAHFVTEQSAADNLSREGVDPERVHFVGNVMIDALDRLRTAADASKIRERLGVGQGAFVAVTLHRPLNVDDGDRLAGILEALGEVANRGPAVLFPAHPRTRNQIERFGLEALVDRLHLLDPLGYSDFLALMDAAAVVLTDSGGIQEETTVLGVPCVTLRPNTERPVTVNEGTNLLFYGELSQLPEVLLARAEEPRQPTRPPRWDGRAAARIASVTEDELLDRPR